MQTMYVKTFYVLYIQHKVDILGGSLSSADVLTYLYFEVMDINADNVKGIDRDRFVLSKGHVTPALYSVFAEKGFLSEEDILTFRKLGSKL